METFDFIIVGAGSAGCVLADRLSRNPKNSVLLIEAGPADNNPLIHMPKGYGKLMFDTTYAWQYPVTPSGGRNVPEVWHRGRTLGGSSSMNGMIYVRGQPEDYDDWEANGVTGWGWKSVGAAFKAIEDHELGAGEWRGSGGPLHVGVEHSPGEVEEAFIAAGEAIGLTRKPDLNDMDQRGIGYLCRTIHKGRRFSAARAFLNPAKKRPNLRIVTETEAEKVLFDGQRATGIQCCGPQGSVTYSAGRDIILSLGAMHSPKLLQLSGVGPAAHLRKLGIEVVHDSPGVGGNMREHRCLVLQYRLKRNIGWNRQLRGIGLLGSVARYALFRSGPMAAPSHPAGGFAATRPGESRADIMIMCGGYTAGMDHGKVAIEREPGMRIIAHQLRPESQGSVMIESADPKAPVEVVPNFLASPVDQQVVADMARLMRQLAKQGPLAEEILEELAPTAALYEDGEIIRYTRDNGLAGHHATSTCAMGADEQSVLDPRLRVRGVSGLRVMDASVMPTLVSGNTNGPVMALAWHAANLILEDHAA